jgi:hypothetical protein
MSKIKLLETARAALGRVCGGMSDETERLIARIAELEEVIRDAPHEHDCDIALAPIDYPTKRDYCNCWKSEALPNG